MTPAPLLSDLPTPRPTGGLRFEPSAFTFSRGAFEDDEIRALEALYGRLEGLYRRWLADPTRSPEVVAPELGEDFSAAAHRFADTLRRRIDEVEPKLQELLHDLRGGGLTALVGISDMIRYGFLDDGPDRLEHLQLAVWFARDHAKMMRMALPWLDPERAVADISEQPHGIDDLVRKWSGAHFNLGESEATVRVHAELGGALASRCVEAAALDRVCYNLLNNGARFTADGVVDVHLDAASTEFGRVVVANRVSPTQRDWLAERLGGEGGRPNALFRSGVTRGGQGDGLASVARIVSSVFGLSPGEAVAEGIVGTRLAGDRFAAWFHWPRVVDSQVAGAAAPGG
jgi:signal transduction histidine kinase